jgi:hypothetical protein
MILLAALPATGQAQDLNTVIINVLKATGAGNLTTIRYSGSGSSYTAGKDAVWIKSYTRDIDLSVLSSKVQIVRQQGTPAVDSREDQNIGTDTPWSKQFELWTNPWAFANAAINNKATVSTQTLFGEKYTVVAFTLQNKYKVSGFINGQNLLERIQAWIDPNETPVETIYREYQDFNGLKFPTLIIEKQSHELAMIVVVNDVKVKVGM